MDAKYFIVDNSRERKTVEYVGKGLPDIQRSIFSDAFVIETIDLSNQP
jgi:hypothetical protein